MKYTGYWAVGALTLIAGSSLAGGRRKTLAQTVSLLPSPGCCCSAPGGSAIRMKSTRPLYLWKPHLLSMLTEANFGSFANVPIKKVTVFQGVGISSVSVERRPPIWSIVIYTALLLITTSLSTNPTGKE